MTMWLAGPHIRRIVFDEDALISNYHPSSSHNAHKRNLHLRCHYVPRTTSVRACSVGPSS